MVDAGANSRIMRNEKKFRNYDQIFWPENNHIKLADGSINCGVALKRGNTGVCLLDVDGNRVVDTLKKVTSDSLLLARHTYDKSRYYRWSYTYLKKKKKNELRHKSDNLQY